MRGLKKRLERLAPAKPMKPWISFHREGADGCFYRWEDETKTELSEDELKKLSEDFNFMFITQVSSREDVRKLEERGEKIRL